MKKFISMLLCCIAFISFAQAQTYKEYKGRVVDNKTEEPLVFATITINDSNISTITNNEGEFLLKAPLTMLNGNITITFLGYETKEVPLSGLKENDNVIALNMSVTELEKVDLSFPRDAKTLVLEAFKRKDQNNLNDPAIMTAFYRETIKKRRRNASLTEAVVNIYKEPYSSYKKDAVKLYKVRKSTDYQRLDTIALKLMGGPFNTLYSDLMKYPEYIFSSEMLDDYVFSYDQSARINNQTLYVVNFKADPSITEPRYYGKLYIDSNTLALTRADYSLNVENRKLASEMFVHRKPIDVEVYPTEARYRVDYREKNGKWYYGYSNVHIEFKVNRKKKLFNSVYSLSSEMAITDWVYNKDESILKPRDRMKPSVVINDMASGFSDPEFWGDQNVIEPEKSIESAIQKIIRQLERSERDKGNGR